VWVRDVASHECPKFVEIGARRTQLRKPTRQKSHSVERFLQYWDMYQRFVLDGAVQRGSQVHIETLFYL